MGFEQRINHVMNKVPFLKKMVKRVYQRSMYMISPKIKKEGDITRISPNDPYHEYFFGYYDKSPWDATDRYMLCMRANDTWSDVSPKEKADILLIDTSLPEQDKNRVIKIAETYTWNVQQGCMLQWLGPDYRTKIIFNDYRNGQYVSVIKELDSGAEKIIPAPVYTVSSDGRTALTLDFSRLYNLRPGYGYYNVPEKTVCDALPEATAIWKIDLTSGEISELLTYKDFAELQPRREMQSEGAVHKVNHLMISPNGKRCMVLYRWLVGHRKFTRLITFDVADGGNRYVLSDDDMVSHCFWRNNTSILAFENKKNGGPGYYLMKDKTDHYIHCWKKMNADGHPSYSSKGEIITDTYANGARLCSLMLLKEGETEGRVIARVYEPFRYDNDTRCDLHPRWNRAGTRICFDGAFEGHRGLYTVNVPGHGSSDGNSGFDMTQVRFIMPLHGFYNTLIEKSGYDIRDPYVGNSIIPRLLRELHFRLGIPYKSLWYNRDNVTNKPYIVVYEPLIIPDYLEWLHKRNPGSKIVLLYINQVNRSNNPERFRFDWCELWTSDPKDAAQYGLNLYEGISAFRAFKIEKRTPRYDVFYVGKDKGRLKKINELKGEFEKIGLKPYFHIVSERRVPRIFTLGKHYKPRLSYEEVLHYVGESRAILHIISGSQQGITMRIIESLVYEVKLITDYAGIKAYDFYDPENIFILGEDYLEDLASFLNRPYKKVKSKYFEHLYFEDGIAHILKADGERVDE